MFQTGCSTNRLLRYATVSINKGHTWYVLHAHEWLLISDATSSKELHRPCAVYESLLCTWKTRRLWFLFLFPFWHEFDPFPNANRFLYLDNWKQCNHLKMIFVGVQMETWEQNKEWSGNTKLNFCGLLQFEALSSIIYTISWGLLYIMIAFIYNDCICRRWLILPKIIFLMLALHTYSNIVYLSQKETILGNVKSVWW